MATEHTLPVRIGPARALAAIVVALLATLTAQAAHAGQEVAGWDFTPAAERDGRIAPAAGARALVARRPVRWSDDPPALELGGPKGAPAPLLWCEDAGACGLPQRAITVHAWVRVDEARPWAGVVSAVQDNGSFERGWVLGTEASGRLATFGLVSEGSGRITYLSAAEALTPGAWHHLAGVYDGERMTLHVDGRPVARTTAQHGPILYADSGPAVVGAYADDTEVHALRGALGSVRVLSAALSGGEVAALHEAGRGVYPAADAAPQAPARAHATSGWATHRGNSGRTAFTTDALPERLGVRWRRELPAPSPAWPAPAAKSYWQNLDHIEPRVTDDRALHPVLAGGAVLIASSADDSVVCLEADSGRLRWRVTTGGPVRFAPAVAAGLVYFASDDGLVYCARLTSGEVLWTRAIGPRADRISGNGRLISPYPVRTGLLVEGGVVYACAGLFPSQGVHAAALDARTGEPLWTRELGERSPQGYLLATDGHVVVPAGRGTPFSLRKGDGADGPAMAGAGGTYAVVAGDRVLSGPGNDNTIVGADAASGARVVSYAGEHLAIAPRFSYLLHKGELTALDRTRYNALLGEKRRLENLLKGDPEHAPTRERLLAIQGELGACVAWRAGVPTPATSLLATPGAIAVGGDGRVTILDPQDGGVRQTVQVRGEVRSLATAGGRLIATTGDGAVYCLAEAQADPGARARLWPRATPEGLGGAPEWAALADRAGVRAGYAVLVDPPAITPVLGAAASTPLRIVVLHADRDSVSALRQRLHELGLYGTRVAVHHAPPGAMGVGAYVAAVVADLGAGRPLDDLLAMATPGRGVVRLADGSTRVRPPLEGAGSWTHQFANASNDANGRDRHTTADLALQWFGGPGPRRMIDRHMRGPPPLVAGGRTFMVGENRIIAVDSYTGLEQWDTPLPDSQRYAMPYDGGYIACDADRIYAAVDAELWMLDTATGAVLERRRPPADLAAGRHVGVVMLEGGRLYATAMRPTAPRTEPGRTLADQSYRSRRPIVTSEALYASDAVGGEPLWVRTGGVILNPTVTVHGGLVCFVESRAPAALSHDSGRIPLADLLSADAYLVALDAESGRERWRTPLSGAGFANALYLLGAGDRLVLCGSRDAANNDAYYELRAYDVNTGGELWRAEHPNNKPGQLYHGEQVHHPVVLGSRLVAEPYIYDLATGAQASPTGEQGWSIKRPGHSCGTMSGSMDCLFFRASNPTVMDLSSEGAGGFTRLSPSRVGCWINIIPADGLVIIPEASSSCVCTYALQTSMAFRPRPDR